MMLDAFGVTEANWRDATERIPHFAISETPRFVGRAVAALAADPDVRAPQRRVALQRRPRAGVRLHRPRRQPPGLLALHGRGPGPRPARERRPVPLTSPRAPRRRGSRAALPRARAAHDDAAAERHVALDRQPLASTSDGAPSGKRSSKSRSRL